MAHAQSPQKAAALTRAVLFALLLCAVVDVTALVQPRGTLRPSRFLLSEETDTAPHTATAVGPLPSIAHIRQLKEDGTKQGSYTLIASEASFVDFVTSPLPSKTLRLLPRKVLRPCAALSIEAATSAAIDCRGATLDLRCGSSFVVEANASVELYNCHVLWPLVGHFFNAQSPTGSLRIEQGGSLLQQSGSSTIDCTGLSVREQQALFGAVGPQAGDVVGVENWMTTMGPCTGTLKIRDADMYCTGATEVGDTSTAEFATALQAAVAQPGAVVPVTGLLSLVAAEGWNEQRALLLGTTVLQGLSPFAAIDFQRAREVFAPLPLDGVDGEMQPARLVMRNLHLFNLPHTFTAGDEQLPGGISPRALSALLWISKQRNPSADSVLYELHAVTASVSCAEVAFLKRFFHRLKRNAAASPASAIVTDFMVGQEDTELRFARLQAFGMNASGYVISCKAMPRTALLASGVDVHLAQGDPAVLADFMMPPEAASGSGAPLGHHSGLKIVALCVAGGLLLAAVACCWWGRQEVRVEQPHSELCSSNSTYKPPHDPHPLSMRWNEPPELEALSDRLAVTSAKAISSGEHSSPCDPARHLLPAHGSDPSTPAVPGASALSRSSLDLGHLAGPFVDKSSTLDGSTARTDAAPSTEVSGTSVICAGGAADPASTPLVVASVAASPQPLTPEEWAQQCLAECQRDCADEHLEVEGVLARGAHGPVLWGSWRGLEVTISSFVLKVPLASAHAACEQLKQQAQAAHHLSHANIVTTLAHDLKHAAQQERVALYLIQEYCAGGSLATLVRQGHLHSGSSGEVGVVLEHALMLLEDIAAGMACMHSQNIVHGELQPGNVLLQVPPSERVEEPHSWPHACPPTDSAAAALQSGQCTAKISGFALGGLLDIEAATLQSASLLGEGSPAAGGHYLAPELADCAAPRTTASDAFAFGVIMWELVVPAALSHCRGRGASAEVAAPTFPATCPFNYAVLALACMAANPDDRPPMLHVQQVLQSVDTEIRAAPHYLDWTGSQRAVAALGGDLACYRVDSPLLGSAVASSGCATSKSSEASGGAERPGNALMQSWPSEHSVHSVESVSFYTSVDAAPFTART